jgi:hypothetical protein
VPFMVLSTVFASAAECRWSGDAQPPSGAKHGLEATRGTGAVEQQQQSKHEARRLSKGRLDAHHSAFK